MTEKIIIDGVDVSDCRLRQYNSDLCNGFKMDNSGFHQGHCRQNPNCYFKQLKRLEQENRELKEEIQFHNKENSILLAERNAAQIGYDEIREVRERYRSVLEEILESAKFAQCLPCGSGNLEECLNCADETTNNGQFCMEKRIHEIKTKCVEVLGEV